MKKKLLVFLFLLLSLVPAWAATTTHYAYVLPTVGASQNVWGTLLNNIFTTIDNNIWSASSGTTIGVNAPSASGSNIVLTNPINNIQNIQFSTTGKSLVLSAMNATSSPVVGGTFYVNNVGSNAFSILATDASTVLVASLLPGQTVQLTLTSSGTANGTFSVYGPFVSFGSTISAGGFIPTGTTIPTAGYYAPAANTTGISAQSQPAVEFTNPSTAVNYLTLTGAITGNAPILGTAGTDTNIGLELLPQGTGNIGIGTAKPQVSLDLSQRTDAILLPIGTTGQEPSPATAGMVRYNSSTPAIEAYYGGLWNGLGGVAIGTSGQAAYYATNGSNLSPINAATLGASWILISSQTASTSSSVSFTSLPQIYDQCEWRFTNIVPSAAGANFYLTLSENNGSSYLAANYSYQSFAWISGASGPNGNASASQYIINGGSNAMANTAGGSGIIDISSLGSTTLLKPISSRIDFIANGGAGTGVLTGGQYNGDTGAINAANFAMSSGTFSGQIALYCLRKQ